MSHFLVCCKTVLMNGDLSPRVGRGVGSVAPRGGIRCENFDTVPCRLLRWRVSREEPKDLNASPEIPEGAEWKHRPVE